MTHHDFDPTTLLDALRENPSVDLVRDMVAFLYQALIDAEAAEVIGAAPHERSVARTVRRNGNRPKLVTTKAGDVGKCRSRVCGLPGSALDSPTRRLTQTGGVLDESP